MIDLGLARTGPELQRERYLLDTGPSVNLVGASAQDLQYEISEGGDGRRGVVRFIVDPCRVHGSLLFAVGRGSA